MLSKCLMTAKTVHLETLPIHVLLSDGKQIFTNLPKSSPLSVFNRPILPEPTDSFQTNVGGSYFLYLKKKKYIQTNSIPSLWTAFNEKFYGHCDVNDCGHCGSFGPSVRGRPKLAEDHCERVETLHLRPTQTLDNNNHRPRQGALCVLVVCNVTYTYLYWSSDRPCFTFRYLLLSAATNLSSQSATVYMSMTKGSTTKMTVIEKIMETGM